MSIAAFLASQDPLTETAVRYLIEHREEPDCLDYKQTFDPKEEKNWLELTKDVSAFANTHGGYLVFGVNDQTKSLTGLGKEVADVLVDINNVQQKLNRHLRPELDRLRAKNFEINGHLVAALHVPQSVGRTHMISKDAGYKQPSGDIKIVVRVGTFYVRRSGGNHLGDADDLERLLERRIGQFREALLDKVVRVVNAPIDSEIRIIQSAVFGKKNAKTLSLSSADDATEVKGLTFTVAPTTLDQEIAACSSLAEANIAHRPAPDTAWSWYAQRDSISVGDPFRIALFRFCISSGVPAFYWIRGLEATDIKGAIMLVAKHATATDDANYLLHVAAFLGESFYDRVVATLETALSRPIHERRFPGEGARRRYGLISLQPRQTEEACRVHNLAELNAIAKKVGTDRKSPPVMEKWKAQKIDCYLYAQDDCYRKRG